MTTLTATAYTVWQENLAIKAICRQKTFGGNKVGNYRKRAPPFDESCT